MAPCRVAASPHRDGQDRGTAAWGPAYGVAMIDHVELFTSDLPTAVAFYQRALAPLGYALRFSEASHGFGSTPDSADFWLRAGEASTPRPHFAFFCATRAVVDAAHRAALDAGGADNGAPKVLLHIGPNYYAGFVRDPDGHNVEFVCRT
jgi:catechol 2,3-dioxygenase-like lactoylglutathione lyase family enzyme